MHVSKYSYFVPMVLCVLSAFLFCAWHDAPSIHAQEPTPIPVATPNPLPPAPEPKRTSKDDNVERVLAVVLLALDTLQGKTTVGADLLFAQAKQSAENLVNSPGADLFFLDFGNPNLPLNQFAGTVARNLLALTPLYALGYLAILIYGVWKERPIPNPILYAALVAGVMFFLAAFAIITQGMSELGRALAIALGGTAGAMYARPTLLDTVIRILVMLQKHGGIAALALLVAIVEAIIVLVQLVYRGLSMAIWRLIGVLLIPLSVLLEGTKPRTAGKVISGFFEAWLDMVGKITLLLIVLSIASADALADYVWLVLPAGLLVVVSSWKFFGLLFVLVRDSVARGWANFSTASEVEPMLQLPPAGEAARAREIDAERRRLIRE
jgi:hypothetical protein